MCEFFFLNDDDYDYYVYQCFAVLFVLMRNVFSRFLVAKIVRLTLKKKPESSCVIENRCRATAVFLS